MRGGQNNNNSRRSEYVPRQQQDSPNPTPQASQPRDRDRGGNSNNMPPSQQTPHQQQQQPPQQMDSGNQAAMAYPFPAYQYYSPYYGQGMMHSQSASAAQNVTGAPIYVASPYMPHPMYNYPFVYSHVMPHADYQIYDDNGEMYYAPIPETDINHNPASGETPTMLSPAAGYASIYDPQMHEMHQQMNAVHMYDPQVAQPPPHMVGTMVDIEQTGEGIPMGEQILSPHDQEAIVGPGPVPQEVPYILAPVDNQLNNSG